MDTQSNDIKTVTKAPVEHSQPLKVHSEYTPAGDQPKAIAALTQGLEDGLIDQVLLGATGTGKTFTMAHIIQNTQRPALILAPNKTLAAQLYGEMRSFFPDNAVEYFVSYYDYYQPEAYVARSDTFIEKDASINEQIDRLRHAATRSLFERRDLIIVASVSCIYGIGSKEDYQAMTLDITPETTMERDDFIKSLVELQYTRNDIAFQRGTFRVRGDTVELFPVHTEDRAWRFSFFGDEIEDITEFDPLTAQKFGKMPAVRIYANSHYITSGPTISQAVQNIKIELKDRIAYFEKEGKLLELQRIEQRTKFDLEMLEATNMCQGIENYSRYLTGRASGQAPPTLFEYLPDDALLFVDESHGMIPQLRAMYNGDRSRKTTLAEYGFRLPSCLDNRPLKFDEWNNLRPQTIFVSATPGPWELEQTNNEFVEQVVRPTGLIDPPVEIRPTDTQVDDLMEECRKVIALDGRVLVTTLTKKMAEDLSEYLNENGLKVRYMHSDTDTIERIEIIRDLRLGVFDVLVGINLLREGLDIPECMRVCILDADKEGYLRSRTSLIQTIGRAARNVDARVILYADRETDSMKAAIEETDRRRQRQVLYNTEHGITPRTVKKDVSDILEEVFGPSSAKQSGKGGRNLKKLTDDLELMRDASKLKSHMAKLEKDMRGAAANLEFEEAARLRDEIKRLETLALSA